MFPNAKDYDKHSPDPRLVLENLKLKNNHRLVSGNFNINSISNKFDNLKMIIQGKIDILVITETKTDSTFPLNQFTQNLTGLIEIEMEVVFIYINVREDTPSRELKIHNTPEDIESIFIQINLIKTEWLFCGCYHPPRQSDQYFFENIGKILDKYSKTTNELLKTAAISLVLQ